MEPATIAAIGTAVASLITAIGLWLKSRANMNDSFSKLLAAREETKRERDHRADETDIEINDLKNKHTHLVDTVSRLETELERNTNGLKDDIGELRKETNEKMSQLDNKISKYQEDTRAQFDRVIDNQNASTVELTKQISEIAGQLKTAPYHPKA